MKMPLLISVPHAGRRVPEEVRENLLLSEEEILMDDDEGADEIYLPLLDRVRHLVTTDVPRAVVDVNRAPDDIRKDGVVKTHTFFEVPIWKEPLSPAMIQNLIRDYHEPYHHKLTALSGDVILGVDGHTMSAVGPPVGPDPGRPRPRICLSNQDGRTCPDRWLTWLAESFSRRLEEEVSINDPFKGGYIVLSQSRNIPWIQIEFSREEFLTLQEKRNLVEQALSELVERIQVEKKTYC